MTTDILSTIETSGTRFVRVLWCDNANVIRAKAVHGQMVSHYLQDGVGISAGQQAIPVMVDAVVPDSGLGPVGEIRLVPDWSTFTPLPYAPGHARTLGDMRKEGAAWSCCPRGFLRRMIAAAGQDGLEVQAAFENEFYLLRPATPGLSRPAIIPADETLFAATLAMDLNHKVIDAIAEALIAQGIPVEVYYPESGPGQHEISVRYTGALAAADRQIAYRETVRAIALQHGLRASFLPKIFADKAGSGCHLHMSLWRGGANAMAEDTGLSPAARSWIAGLLKHLPALMALTTPSTNSYRRIRPHFWSGAFRAWGLDNREAAVRVPSSPVGGPTNLELKTVDACSNPYLALGAVIAAGLDGVRHALELGAGVDVDPGNLTDPDRQARGIDRLPTNLGEAIDHLSRDQVLLDALGPELARAYLAVRRAEWDKLKELTLEEEVALLLEKY